MSIGHPIPELWLFQNLTLKIKGQGHEWGHSSKSQCGSYILSIHIPFVPCQSALPFLIRKSKDYVYGIWVYKALDIWKGYYRVKKSLVSYMKPWTEARNNKYMKYHSKLTYQLSFWNVSRKVDYHAGGKWFIHGPKRRKENQLLSLKHPCWLSLV